MCGLPAYGRDYSLKAHSVNTCIYRVYVREFSVVARRPSRTRDADDDAHKSSGQTFASARLV